MAQRSTDPISKECFEKWRKQFFESSARRKIKKPDINFEDFTAQQRQVVKLVEKQLAKSIGEMLNEPFRAILVSQAGSGKSTILSHIKYLMELKKRKDPEFDYRLVVLTGTCAFHLRISTVHSAFKIPPKFKDDYLKKIKNGQALTEKMAAKLKKVQWIVFDEISLVSLRLFYTVDLIMRSADPQFGHVPFASRSLILCGDPLQPLAVGDFPMFQKISEEAKSPFYETSQAYMEIDRVFRLTKSLRQSGDSEEHKMFRNFLLRLRYNCTVREDVDYVRARLKNNLTKDERGMFDNALHVFTWKREVRAHNRKMLGKQFKEDEIIHISNGTEPLCIAISAPIVITKNLSTDLGITNGSRGYVKDVIFTAEDQPGVYPRKVKCVIADIPHYLGRKWMTGRGSGFPIFRYAESVFCHDTNDYVGVNVFPIQLCYGITKHKIQGLTLDKLAVHLGEKEVWAKLDYLCFSRVNQLNQIMITDKCIADDRFTTKSKEIINATERQKFEMIRLRKLLQKHNAF